MVQDNDSLRQSIVSLFNQQGHQTSGLICAEDVDDTPLGTIPDVYVIDTQLPGESGYSLSLRLRQAQPQAGIVLLAPRNHLQDRLKCFHSGADHALAQPVELDELLACINSLSRWLKPAQRNSAVVLCGTQLSLKGPQSEVQVTQGEFMLLASLCRAAGNKLERWQAMQLIDPNDKGLVGANLEMRISALRKKLLACGAPADAIRTLRGYGYALSYPLTILA